MSAILTTGRAPAATNAVKLSMARNVCLSSLFLMWYPARELIKEETQYMCGDTTSRKAARTSVNSAMPFPMVLGRRGITWYAWRLSMLKAW